MSLRVAPIVAAPRALRGGWAMLAWLLAACTPPPAPPSWNGYVEVELLRVAAPVGGRLTSLAVQRGDGVAAGAPLFALEHDSEAAAVREARHRVERAEAAAKDLDKGLRRDELAAAAAALDAAQADAQRADAEWRRQRDLAAAGFVSGSNLDALKSQREAAAARVRQLQAQLRQGRQGARDDAREAARAEVRAAREVLAQGEWRLQQKTVAAPAAARVEDTLYRVGEWVAAGAPVVTLIEPGALKLRFYVPEAELATLALGQPLLASCDGCGAPLRATLRRIAREAEFTPPVIYSQRSREKLVFLAEAVPDPADAARLRPGQPVDVRRP